MLSKRSRYATARSFDGADDQRFPGLRSREIGPATGVVEHTVCEGDRLDILAQHYYNDDRLWWRIVDANPEILHAGDAVTGDMIGRVLLIPAARE